MLADGERERAVAELNGTNVREPHLPGEQGAGPRSRCCGATALGVGVEGPQPGMSVRGDLALRPWPGATEHGLRERQRRKDISRESEQLGGYVV